MDARDVPLARAKLAFFLRTAEAARQASRGNPVFAATVKAWRFAPTPLAQIAKLLACDSVGHSFRSRSPEAAGRIAASRTRAGLEGVAERGAAAPQIPLAERSARSYGIADIEPRVGERPAWVAATESHSVQAHHVSVTGTAS